MTAEWTGPECFMCNGTGRDRTAVTEPHGPFARVVGPATATGETPSPPPSVSDAPSAATAPTARGVAKSPLPQRNPPLFRGARRV